MSDRSVTSGLSVKSNKSGISKKSNMSNNANKIKAKEFENIKKINTENEFILKNISRYKPQELPAYIKSISRSLKEK